MLPFMSKPTFHCLLSRPFTYFTFSSWLDKLVKLCQWRKQGQKDITGGSFLVYCWKTFTVSAQLLTVRAASLESDSNSACCFPSVQQCRLYRSITHAFYFSTPMLQHWDVADAKETDFPRVSLLLQIENNLPAKACFICILTNPDIISPTIFFLSASHILGHYTLALTISGPGSRQLGTALMPQSLLKFFKMANYNEPANLVLCFASCGNNSTIPCQWFSLTLYAS